MATTATSLSRSTSQPATQREEGAVSWAYAALVGTAAAPALIKIADLAGLQLVSVAGITALILGIVAVFAATAALTRKSVRRERSARA